ncbi:ATP-binding cassette domain-containing protein [Shinella sp. AETb1-6]|uniref:zinc ABC transporter ATP-binding protein AztA n=1 Tax=Shinella sp. AETb1-6 TaxID=2692210 RepID=UPI00136AC52C|nr:zinc ABC transporter ATP-binding protein AztA [Shinella sp. AETb1-6]MXN52812.1 ATP-binding cassette domain-containing protein [Shinella sp. AETb1-6]
MTGTCLHFENLTLGYQGHPAVHHINGEVTRGALTAIVGANGSGKSTLMKGIASILKPIEGRCTVSCDRLAYLPQQSELDRSFPARVIDLVSMGFWQKRGLLGRITPQDRADMARSLKAVGLTGFEKRPLDSLSGGQMQRALFARTMLQDADLILLDEPFNAVDSRTVRDLLDLIRSWSLEGRTVLCVLHDLDLVRAHFPQAFLLARSLVAAGPTAGVLTANNLARARDFQEAWDEKAGQCVSNQSFEPRQSALADRVVAVDEHEDEHRRARARV